MFSGMKNNYCTVEKSSRKMTLIHLRQEGGGQVAKKKNRLGKVVVESVACYGCEV